MTLWLQGAILAAVFALGAWGGIRWHQGQDAIAEVAAREARESDERQQRRNADKAAVKHESDKARIRTEIRTVLQEVDRVVEKPVYRDGVCWDADGLRIVAESISGPRTTSSEPAAAVPRLAAPSGWLGRLGAALGSGGDRPVPRVSEPPP